MFSESVGRRKWRRAGEQALMAVPGPRIWPDCAVGGRREWGQTGAQALGGKWPAAERGGANQVEAWGREGPAAWVLPLGEPGGDGVALDGCGRGWPWLLRREEDPVLQVWARMVGVWLI